MSSAASSTRAASTRRSGSCRSRPPAAPGWMPGWRGSKPARAQRASGAWTRWRRCSAASSARGAGCAAAVALMHSPMLADTEVVERRAIRVRGTVQGVGFRPFVYRLAQELASAGWVLQRRAGRGHRGARPGAGAAAFRAAPEERCPPLSRVDARGNPRRRRRSMPTRPSTSVASRSGAVTTSVPPDTATCADCLAELFDPVDRRYRYAFINCTQCGPRYTLTRTLPYDRATTSMAPFALCPACEREYSDPLDRRFHAEPNACPVCGPALRLVDAAGRPIPGDPIAATLALLRDGRDRRHQGPGRLPSRLRRTPSAEAVARLRQRKQREEKPFAVMVANAAFGRCAGCTRPPPNKRCCRPPSGRSCCCAMREDATRCAGRHRTGSGVAGR